MYCKNKGYTLIELVLVMALLALFGIATLSLVISGSNAYKGIVEKKNNESELRVAVSYIETKIRQNDTRDAISLRYNPAKDGKALVIGESADGTAYETWIYLSSGKLREVLVEKGEPVQDDFGFEIAAVEGFYIKYDNEKKLLRLELRSNVQAGMQELESSIAIKSGITVVTAAE